MNSKNYTFLWIYITALKSLSTKDIVLVETGYGCGDDPEKLQKVYFF